VVLEEAVETVVGVEADVVGVEVDVKVEEAILLIFSGFLVTVVVSVRTRFRSMQSP